MSINTSFQVGVQSETYDAIVIGSGVSGGWAAKELTEKGLKTLVLERGRPVEHRKDYITEHTPPWEFDLRGQLTKEEQEKYAQATRIGYLAKTALHFFAPDSESPYKEEKPFVWARGYQVGGKSITWGRFTFRISDLDFEANLKEGVGVDWPIRYKDIAPWYDYVEKFAGISGEKLGLAHLPDGQFQKPMELNVVEKHLRKRIRELYPERYLTIARAAVLTEQIGERSPCHYCGPCWRGCSTGSYFSSLSSTLPAAAATGNLTIRPYSVVHSIDYDKESGKAKGVNVIDSETRETIQFRSKLVFVCASAMASTQILLNSKSDEFPDGIGNTSGVLGHYLMDHHLGLDVNATVPGFTDRTTFGNRPIGFYIPRYRNIGGETNRTDFTRGYGFEGSAYREGWGQAFGMEGFGADFKEKVKQAGPWKVAMWGFGETLPYYENKAYLHDSETDDLGIPKMVFDAEIKENEKAMRKDCLESISEMLDNAGCTNIHAVDNPAGAVPGFGIHEMGTARMGRDPKTSYLNGYNQAHEVPNLFVTDGACMTSAPCQNPSITYMALTARAVDYAVKGLKSKTI
ncbi:GMC oxidoreductase [Marinoscillum sp.]|uniref:GMC oxidoreductase n=1 Tax=Marinoscillum sp. TaxID=2024838 RepID=UPI003BAC80F9